MERTALDQLMKRYVTGDVSEAERVKIEAWLDAIGTEDNTDLELSKEEEDRIFSKLTNSLTTIEEIVALKPRRKTRPEILILRIAASLAMVAVLSYAAWYFAPRENALEVVSKNGVEKIILNDGSLVWLRKESKVLYYEKADEKGRYATFEGEGLFEVAKDADRPFVVQCGDARVRVLGTSFSIRTNPDIVEVTVLTGKVNFSSSTNAEGLDLLPLEKAIYRSDGTFAKLETQHQEIASLTENTGYNMHFSNTDMAEVFQRLEGKFNVTVKLSDPAIRNCRITIDLTDKSLDHSLRLVSEVLNLKYTVERKTVTISGNGCKP